MTVLFYALIAFVFFGGLAWLFVSTPPAKLAKLLSRGVPLLLVALGGLLIAIGRGGAGISLAAIGIAWWRRSRPVGSIKGGKASQRSTVRSAALEMELDHDSGDMNGKILTGNLEGKWLSELDDSELFELYTEIRSDGDSAALLEAYLDRRLSGWRENADTNAGSGQSDTPTSGGMTKQEAYQVLGLEPGASKTEIRKAWRNLMKTMHPDSGGSAFLAAKINAAKDILLD
jgi:hypothetical protein